MADYETAQVGTETICQRLGSMKVWRTKTYRKRMSEEGWTQQ